MIQQFPATERVLKALRDGIERGEFPCGAWLPTERELAARLAVSRPIVRSALAELSSEGLIVRAPGCRPRVSEAILEAVQPGRRLAVHTLGVMMPHLPTYAMAHAIVSGIHRALHDREDACGLRVFDTHPHAPEKTSPAAGAEREQAAIEMIEREGLAGVVVWHYAGEATLPALRSLHDRGVPVVFIDRCPAGLECDYVGVDNAGGVRQAVEHLVGLGHRRIGYLTIPERVSTVMERERGFRDALASLGVPYRPELVFPMAARGPVDLGHTVERALALPGSERPTAVVALNDLHAFAFMRAAEARGWRAPDDVSVVGFDDIEDYSPHPAVLTTVHQPFYEMGRRAAAMLLARLDPRRTDAPATGAGRTYRHVLLPTSLRMRATCRPPRADGP